MLNYGFDVNSLPPPPPPNAKEESDDTETLNGAQKYREIWNLRATFEEEEDFSDTIRMEDMTSPDQSPEEREQVTTSYTTSFESNTEATPYFEESDQNMPSDSNLVERAMQTRRRSEILVNTGSSNLLHPNYENRRQTYRSILTKRLQKMEPQTSQTSTDNSFDSVETVDTDGEISDTSRHEVTTTSFESTTDNTDSTGDSQTHKLQQMKADSGYKSLETQKPPKLSKKQIHFAIDQDSQDPEDNELKTAVSLDAEAILQHSPVSEFMQSRRSYRRTSSQGSYFDRRTTKTASKKRREFSRERQMIHVYDSICEPETDSKSDQPSGDSFDENQAPSKFSVFSRFFKSHHRERREPRLQRDYSIDSKTDALFNEFIRVDPDLDPHNVSLRVRPRPLHYRARLTRKDTQPSFELETIRRNKLTPEMRSVSMGSDSSASSSVAAARRLSPQDSFEDNYTASRNESNTSKLREVQSRPSPTFQPSTIHEIPIIKLPEEEASGL